MLWALRAGMLRVTDSQKSAWQCGEVLSALCPIAVLRGINKCDHDNQMSAAYMPCYAGHHVGKNAGRSHNSLYGKNPRCAARAGTGYYASTVLTITL